MTNEQTEYECRVCKRRDYFFQGGKYIVGYCMKCGKETDMIGTIGLDKDK